ncbi:MAG: 23S rRNA (pseudouridine(1915)-N(3))-methyltransferase RlmH [Clostridia bacterium]|jgi:23S rRNA (pseudouridine1915-N3)-methyltransferase|nr:23S rRNA (pseudouridine(1915)-N(3))-methyltransferase RlmH [Clostridia bacterium]MDD4145587.1 23S rRNA (pseudouridine(1915)-N(3))-methyltransferase RlmH [Clostridia bacterium]MDD4665236.1 23S rRNA (pseudouridine(1915)-N(3))-methyltransferase RlmH [Clostridia bacterium]
MQIRIIAVGKLKEKYWREAVREYSKRMKPYAVVEIIEVAEQRTADHPSPVEIEQVLRKEGAQIAKLIPSSAYVIPLAIAGERLSSEGLSGFIDRLIFAGKSKIVFIIGSSYGISREILEKGDFLLSFSPMTFPHQMMRVILLEQIYRSMKILKHEPYHK